MRNDVCGTFTLDQIAMNRKRNSTVFLVPALTFEGIDAEWNAMLPDYFSEDDMVQILSGNTAIVWTSFDKSVAAVDANRVITAVGKGTVVSTAITAQPDGKTGPRRSSPDRGIPLPSVQPEARCEITDAKERLLSQIESKRSLAD